jgi:DNA-binding MarR family transcriptional regulator
MANALSGPLIKRLHDTLEKRANKTLRSQDLTMVQNSVLILLAAMPGKQASLKEVEKLMHVAQSTTAGIVVRLEQKGLVESFEDPADRRIKRIRVTPQGEQCCVFSKVSSTEAEQMLLAGFSEDERATFNRLLQKAIDNVK